jgi:hypothetical protein
MVAIALSACGGAGGADAGTEASDAGERIDAPAAPPDAGLDAPRDDAASGDAGRDGGPVDPPGLSSLPLTRDLQSWTPWYPMARLQGRGERWVSPWVDASSTQFIREQSTWRYPAAADGTNRPNATMPARFALPGYYAEHDVEYYLNINCHDVGACGDPSQYYEVISESPGAYYLELWGTGGGTTAKAYFDPLALPGGRTLENGRTMWAEAMTGRSEHRHALAFGVPARAGSATAGNVSCGLLIESGVVMAAVHVVVVTEHQGERADTARDPSGARGRSSTPGTSTGTSAGSPRASGARRRRSCRT